MGQDFEEIVSQIQEGPVVRRPTPARDQLLRACAGAISTASVCGFLTWLFWACHTLAGWLA